MSHDFIIVRGVQHRHSTLQRDWQCRCGSKLVMKWRDGWVTECANDPSHDPDTHFVSQAQAAIDEGKMQLYQHWYDKERGKRMAFVKDRHTKDGALAGRFRVRKAGRIALGEQRQGGGARALPYFVFKPFDEGAAGEAVIAQTRAAIEKFAPGIDSEKPVVLPVYFPAESLDLMASSVYKLAGKDGHPRCVGDGEIVNFKLGERNLLEVSNDTVTSSNLSIDGQQFMRGETVPCPGRAQEGRWSHCEKCRLLLTIDLQVANLPYIWQVSTGDQSFYDQFFSTLALCSDYINRGAVRFLTEIPLLLRREEGVRARPSTKNDETYLTWQDMPTLTIEIHPIWKAQMDASRSLALQSGAQTPQIEAAKPKAWHERARTGMAERPWGPMDVGAFVTRAMAEYSADNDNFDKAAPQNTVKLTKNLVTEILSKAVGEEGVEKYADLVFWFLFGGNVQTYAQCAAVYRWAKDAVVHEGKEGTAPSPHFEQELLDTLAAASEAAANEARGTEETPPDVELDGEWGSEEE